MTDLLVTISETLATSELRSWIIYLLSNVPGLPPIVQTIHILAIATIMGSVIFVNLRFLGLAVPSQNPGEMIKRLMPFTWWAFPPLVLSGLVFVFARPDRYFFNPVFGIKFSLLVPALLLALWLYLPGRRNINYWDESALKRGLARTISVFSVLAWLGVMLAGRWIAYSDYLFW